MAKKKKLKLEIGKTYKFDYESTSKSKSKSDKETRRVILEEDVRINLIEDIKDGAVSSIERFEEMCGFAEDILSAESKELKAELKVEFKEHFGSSDEASDETKARYLFFRNYKPEGITISDDGAIEAVFAGWNCTVTGKVTYKWYVLTSLDVPLDKITENIDEYLEDIVIYG